MSFPGLVNLPGLRPEFQQPCVTISSSERFTHHGLPGLIVKPGRYRIGPAARGHETNREPVRPWISRVESHVWYASLALKIEYLWAGSGAEQSIGPVTGVPFWRKGTNPAARSEL